jgi:hypothetical protein
MSKLKKIMGRGAIIIVLFAALITAIHQPMPALSQQFYQRPLLVSGSTPAGNTAWQPYGGEGIFVDVDTSSFGFQYTPIYITSLGGTASHWWTTGATSIYAPTPKGFRVFVRWSTGGPLTPAIANQNGWHINWIASMEGVRISEESQ